MFNYHSKWSKHHKFHNWKNHNSTFLTVFLICVLISGSVNQIAYAVDGESITEVATLTHDMEKAKHNSLVQVDSDTYALAYTDDDDGIISTFTISADGTTITEVATLTHDTLKA